MTKPTVLVATALSLSLAACTTQKQLRHVGERVDRSVSIKTYRGETEGSVRFVGDRLEVVDKLGRVIPSDQIQTVTATDRGRGALMGLGLGLLGGAIVGVAAGFAEGDDPQCDNFCVLRFSAEDKAAINGVVFGGVGGLVGALVGLGVGAKTEYGAEAPVRFGGPQGSTAGMTLTF